MVSLHFVVVCQTFFFSFRKILLCLRSISHNIVHSNIIVVIIQKYIARGIILEPILKIIQSK